MTDAQGMSRLPELPNPPRTVEETGLTMGFLVELGCKVMYFGGILSLSAIAEELALPVSVAGDVMEFLTKERFAEIKKGSDIRASYIYSLTDLGRERAREYLRFSGYVGPAPVTLGDYAAMARNQSIRRMTVKQQTMREAFDGVILAPGLIDRLGPAVNSGRSIFLYGPTGNGKTFIGERLAKVLSGYVLIPHGLCVDNQVIRVYDPVNHIAIPMGPRPNLVTALPEERAEYDRRWVPCKRPVVVSGGELTLAMLDLSYNPVSKFYEAPLQVKANGGIFLIDDLGRQLVRPFDLLNRWIVPLERARDYLTLQNGKKFEIPFDQIVLFSTNIEPRELADEAFLRRIGYKIKIDYVREEEYVAICRQECERLGLGFQPEVIQYLIHVVHAERGVPLSACHPNDVLSRVVEICQYNGEKPRLGKELILRACRDYFTEL